MVNRVVIVGASLAGASAAFALREAGFSGSIVLVGEEPHLPYERPPLSKGYLRGEEPAEKAHVRPAGDYETNDISLLLGSPAIALDRAERRVVLDSGRQLAYDRLLLATGVEPRALDVPGASLDGVITLRHLDDADALRSAAEQAESVVVVGGGWIGSEVAASLRQLGHRVTLVMSQAQPLERVLGPEVGSIYADLHRSHGVELVTGRVAAIDGDDRVASVRFADGRSLPAQLVVAGVGATPRIELAREADLEIADGGIAVDAQLRTSDANVFAAGDVATAFHPRFGQRLRVEHWDNAREQGATAARNMLGAGEEYARTPYFYSDQFDLGMEYRGYAPDWDEVVVRGDTERREFVAFWLRDGRVAAAMNANAWDAADDVAKLVERGAQAREVVDYRVPVGAAA